MMSKCRIFFLAMMVLSVGLVLPVFAANMVFMTSTVPDSPQSLGSCAGSLRLEFDFATRMQEGDSIDLVPPLHVPFAKDVRFYLKLVDQGRNVMGCDPQIPVYATDCTSENAILVYNSSDVLQGSSINGNGMTWDLGFLVEIFSGTRSAKLTLVRRQLSPGTFQYQTSVDPLDKFSIQFMSSSASERIGIRLFDEKYNPEFFFKSDDHLVYEDVYDHSILPDDNQLLLNTMNYLEPYVALTPGSNVTNNIYELIFYGDYYVMHIASPPVDSIIGKVVDQNGVPIEYAFVMAFDSPDSYVNTTTDINGAYTLTGLAPGSYKVEVFAEISGYASQFYSEKPDYKSADPIYVDGYQPNTGVDFELARGGVITGNIDFSSYPGAPFTYIIAWANPEQMQTCRFLESDIIHYSMVEVDGSYTISGLPAGNWIVNAIPPYDYARQYYDNVLDFMQATPVQVDGGYTTTGIDFNLTTGGKISGMVYNQNGVPLFDIDINAYDLVTGHWMGNAMSFSDGRYTIDGLVPGKYLVVAGGKKTGFEMQYFAHTQIKTDAIPVKVTALNETGNIDFNLFKSVLAGDFNGDGDVDGSDLAFLIAHPGTVDLSTFKSSYGLTE